MKKLTPVKNIPERLLQEAIEALDYGLKYYDQYCTSEELGIIKQSIINLHRFSEYTLKYFIAKINPLLVFTKPFDTYIDIKKSHTISFDQALTFYINNLECGLINIPDGYEKNQFKLTLSCLKGLRNNITHWFISLHEVEDVHKRSANILELVYLICLEEEISDTIYEKLSIESQGILDDLINTQKVKLEQAMQKVEEYTSDRTPLDPKEAYYVEVPLFACPDCGNQTLILSDSNDNIFKCTFCKNTEESSECSVGLICNSNKTPKCYLNSWNEEDNSMICDDCSDEVDHRASKD